MDKENDEESMSSDVLKRLYSKDNQIVFDTITQVN